LHHWKLEAPSRGLLVIALLLVPLNFLVLAGLSPHSAGTPIELAIKIAGIALFTFLVYRGSRNLFPTEAVSRWRHWATDGHLLAVAVLGVSVSPLFLSPWLDPDAPSLTPWLLWCGWAALVSGLCVG